MQIAGIQFDLILIRVGRGIAAEHVEEKTCMQTMQFNLRTLDRSTHRPNVHISVTQDTSMSTELRSAYSDMESKKGSPRELVQSVRIAGVDDDYDV